MPSTRRSRIARQIATTTGLSYQRALTVLDDLLPDGAALPRTDQDVTALITRINALEPVRPTPDASVRALVSGPAPLTRTGVEELLAQMRPGVVVTGYWPMHPDSPGPHMRVVVATHTPGQDAVPDGGVEVEDAAIAMTSPLDDDISWMLLPVGESDRFDRWTLERPGTGQVRLTSRTGQGVVSGAYLFHLEQRAALRQVPERPGPVSFVLRSSDLHRCPHLVMSVGHYLPDGRCAHARPQCPTCAGAGVLAGPDGLVPCASGPAVPVGTFVCDGTGTWTGGHAKKVAAPANR